MTEERNFNDECFIDEKLLKFSYRMRNSSSSGEYTKKYFTQTFLLTSHLTIPILSYNITSFSFFPLVGFLEHGRASTWSLKSLFFGTYFSILSENCRKGAAERSTRWKLWCFLKFFPLSFFIVFDREFEKNESLGKDSKCYEFQPEDPIKILNFPSSNGLQNMYASATPNFYPPRKQHQ